MNVDEAGSDDEAARFDDLGLLLLGELVEGTGKVDTCDAAVCEEQVAFSVDAGSGIDEPSAANEDRGQAGSAQAGPPGSGGGHFFGRPRSLFAAPVAGSMSWLGLFESPECAVEQRHANGHAVTHLLLDG